MWTSPFAPQVEEETRKFANPHTEPWSRKKRSDSGVAMGEELEGQQLWSRKWVMPESPQEWLVRSEKKVSKVQFRY